MVIISEKTHTETYRDMVKQFSTDTESAQKIAGKESTNATSAEANNFSMPDFSAPTAKSFRSKLDSKLAAWFLDSKLTAWLRKQAD